MNPIFTDRPRRRVIFTGAGISADSGIETFRGSTGLWEGYNVDTVANLITWRRHRETVHAFYNARRAQLAEVEPNEAHRMIARLQARYPATVNLTQNVDDLLERAGCPDVVHLHGSLTRMQCKACGHEWEIGYRAWDCDIDRCPIERCGSRKGVKPAVVFFNENAPRYADMLTAFKNLIESDVLLVMGTSGQVIDIGSMAYRSRATAILSNLESAWGSPGEPANEDRLFDYVMHGRAAEMAERIEEHVVYLMGTDSFA